jgi:mycothiol synthase
MWQEPGFDLASDAWVVQTADGRIVGYEELYNRHGFAAFEGDGYVHPDFEGQGVGTSLLRALEARALVAMAQTEPDLKVYIRNGFAFHETRAIELHQNEGYAPVRYSWRMEIQLDAPPPPPVWPRSVELRPFQPNEQARAVYEASQEAFEDHWGHVPMPYENWEMKTVLRPGFDPALYFVAWDGGQIAGVSLCRLKTDDVGWVSTLAVRRPWRKRGLGQALLQHSFGEFYRRGIKTIGLGVDAGSLTGATRLYQRVGMKVAMEYVFYQKELRPGREVEEKEELP